MIFSESNISGAYIIEIEKIEDERGFFARVWDEKEFSKNGLETKFVQFSISQNKKKGTIRGMHYQIEPCEETKIVRCTKGKIFDVIIDLREESKTFKKWFSIELSEDNNKMLYVPKGFAHGYQTLENDTDVLYQISEYYNPQFSRGIRWDDNEFNIKWPLEKTNISHRDTNFEYYNGSIPKKNL